MWAPTRESFPILAISGHLAFTAATMLAVVASDAQSTRPAAVGLLAVSLPALAAWLYIESTGWVGPELASRDLELLAARGVRDRPGGVRVVPGDQRAVVPAGGAGLAAVRRARAIKREREKMVGGGRIELPTPAL